MLDANNRIVLTVEEFRELIPFYKDTSKYSDEDIQAFINIAGCYISTYNENCILKCKCRTVAIANMVAHLYTLYLKAKNGGGQLAAAGLVTSATIDKISVQTAVPTNANLYEWWLTQTPYGAAYYALLYSKGPVGFYVGGIGERVFNVQTRGLGGGLRRI